MLNIFYEHILEGCAQCSIDTGRGLQRASNYGIQGLECDVKRLHDHEIKHVAAVQSSQYGERRGGPREGSYASGSFAAGFPLHDLFHFLFSHFLSSSGSMPSISLRSSGSIFSNIGMHPAFIAALSAFGVRMVQVASVCPFLSTDLLSALFFLSLYL